jgi:hypothetical protein
MSNRLGAGISICLLLSLIGCGESARRPPDSGGSPDSGGAGGEHEGGAPHGPAGGTSASGDAGAAQAGVGGVDEPGGAGGVGGASGHGGEGPGGEGPGGQPGCGALARAWCDDGNGCTEDTCAPSGCEHRALPNGMPCQDGDACTSSDQCVAGHCQGSALVTEAQTNGGLRTFGSDPLQLKNQRNGGLSLALSDELLVFTERAEKRGYGVGLELVLVRNVGGTLEPVSRVPTSFAFVPDVSRGFWPNHHGLHLVRLNAHRFALLGRGDDGLSRTSLEIYDVDNAGISLVAERDLGGDGVSVVWDAEGHEDRLWLLSSQNMSAYDIAADGVVTWRARFSTDASAFAASEDHQLLYVGGQRGTFRVDVSDLSNPVVDAAPVIAESKEQRPYQVTLHQNRLLVQSEGLFTIGDARLYSVPDMTLLRRFPSTTAVDSPLGAAFTKDGLLLQRLGYEDTEPSELRAELYSLGSGDVTLSDTFTYADLSALELEDADTTLVPFWPSAEGSLAVLGPSRRVVSTSAGKIAALTGPLQGGFDSVRPAGPGSVVALGRESAHRISLDPKGPSVVDGGPLVPGTGAPLRLLFLEPEASPSSTSSLPLFLNPGGQAESSGRLAWLSAAEAKAPQARGFIDLRSAVRSYAWQVATERLLFRLEPSLKDSSGLVRVYALPASAAARSFEALEPVVLPADGNSYFSGLAVEPTGGAFVIARAVDGSTQVQLKRYQREGDTYRLTTQFTFPCQSVLDDLLIHGQTLALLYDEKQQLLLLNHDASGFHEVASKRLETKGGGTITSRALLGAEGGRLYLSNGYDDEVKPGILTTVDVLSLTDLSYLARYVTPQEMTSFTANAETLVFAGPSALVTATAQCGP